MMAGASQRVRPGDGHDVSPYHLGTTLATAVPRSRDTQGGTRYRRRKTRPGRPSLVVLGTEQKPWRWPCACCA